MVHICNLTLNSYQRPSFFAKAAVNKNVFLNVPRICSNGKAPGHSEL